MNCIELYETPVQLNIFETTFQDFKISLHINQDCCSFTSRRVMIIKYKIISPVQVVQKEVSLTNEIHFCFSLNTDETTILSNIAIADLIQLFG